jgi:hypothetical protein
VAGHGLEAAVGAAVPKWHWLSGDITDAYCANKTTHVSRSFLVWVWPGDGSAATTTAMLIFDRVHSTHSSFKKTFLLHTLNEPAVRTNPDGTLDFEVTAGEGGLSGRMLLPPVTAAMVGGPGHEFEAGGRNYPPTKASGDALDGASGKWRLELSPARPQAYDTFLSVLLPHDARGSAEAATRVRWPSDAVVGAQVRERVAVFVAAMAGLANISSLDLRGGRDLVWGEGGGVTLHACGLGAGRWMTSKGKILGTVAAPSFCLVANVTKVDLEAGALLLLGLEFNGTGSLKLDDAQAARDRIAHSEGKENISVATLALSALKRVPTPTAATTAAAAAGSSPSGYVACRMDSDCFPAAGFCISCCLPGKCAKGEVKCGGNVVNTTARCLDSPPEPGSGGSGGARCQCSGPLTPAELQPVCSSNWRCGCYNITRTVDLLP